MRNNLSLLAICLAALGSCGEPRPDAPFARAFVIGGLDEAIGGEKALAQPGDLLLENDRLRVAILDGRNSMGPGLYGGSLVDADLQRDDPRFQGGNGRDAFNELFPTVSMNVPFSNTTETVYIESDGSDGGPAVVRAVGKGVPFLSLLDLLWGLVGMPEMWMATDYIANPGEPWVTMRTTVSFQENAEPVVDGEPVDYPEDTLDVLGAGVETGIIMGDFFLAGGSLNVFAPGIGFDEDGAVFDAYEQGLNIFADPFSFPFVAGVAEGVSYALIPSAGRSYVPLFSASQTAIVSGIKEGLGIRGRFLPDDAFTFERHFVVGHGDVGSIVDAYVQLRDIPHGRVEGNVFEQGTMQPLSKIDVFVFEPGADKPWSQWRTDVRLDDLHPDGDFAGALPVGDWELQVHQFGRPDPARLPIEVREGETVRVRLEASRRGVLTFNIRDEAEDLLPAKLSIFRADPGQPPNRLPALGDPFIGGDPEVVVFADQGFGDVPLSPGRYIAMASRGLEYEVAMSMPFTIDDARSHHVELRVERGIETPNWVSADFHVHASPSHDSGVSLTDRVRSMVCEGVEFFAGTDHDYLTDYAPVVEAMGLNNWVTTAVGVETTTIEIGHFLGLPLAANFLADVGGAMDWTDMTPIEIIEELKRQGNRAGYDPMVFIAHPRDGILGYFDQYGFDPYGGNVGDPRFSPGLLNTGNPLIIASNVSLEFDALELFTGKRLDQHRTPLVSELDAFLEDGSSTVYEWITRTMEEQDGLIDGTYRLNSRHLGNVDDWFSLLNLGYRFTALANSDTHGMASVEAGCPRNWVVSETDSPGFLDAQALVDAVKKHQVIASYGPFIQLWVDGHPIGSDVVASGDTIEISIEVQAPSWVDVDRVELYENGTLIGEYFVEEGTPSNLRFAQTITHTPARDAWYVAVATGDGSMAPVFTPVEIPYIPLEEAVTEALGLLPAVATFLPAPVLFPKTYPIHPYAITNPIWVDVDGGGFEPAGLPDWLRQR